MITESFPPKLPDSIRTLYPFRVRTLHVSHAADAEAAGNSEECDEARSARRLEQMSFVDEGPQDAPPLVLVHGNLTWSFLFRKLITEARAYNRVIAPDLIGFGLSSKPRDAAYHTLDQHAENLAELITGLGLTKLTLVLHGLAGAIGFRYVMRFPENVSRMVLLNAWIDPRAADLSERLPFWLAAASSKAGFMLRYGRFIRFPDLRWAATKKLEQPIRAAYSLPFRQSRNRVAPLAFARLLQPSSRESQLATMRELAPQLEKFPASVQILWGEQDPTFRSKLLPYLLRDALPHCSEPVFVSGASHLLPEDAPELLAEKVLQAERRTGSESLFKIF